MREDLIDSLTRHYKLIRSHEISNEDVSIEEGEDPKRGWGKYILLFLLGNIVPILIILATFLTFLLVFSIFFDDDAGKKELEMRNSKTFWAGGDYRGYFSADLLDYPYGIPVERGLIGMGVDLNMYGPSDSYGLRTYAGHMGQDISRILTDKMDGYLPYLLATHRGVVKQIQQRRDDPNDSERYIYDITTLTGLEYVKTQDSIKKKLADIVDPTFRVNTIPYGQQVVLSTYDGVWYTRYAHMDAVAPQLGEDGWRTVERGDAIGAMGETGNSAGVHLHYEILYCGNDNRDFHKSPGKCRRLNPFGYIEALRDNFLGIDPSKVRSVFAGNDTARQNTAVSSTQLASTAAANYNSTCNSSLASQGATQNLTPNECRLFYSVKNAVGEGVNYFPDIPGYYDRTRIARNYLLVRYGSPESFSEAKRLEVEKIERLPGGSGKSTDSLLSAVANAVSCGKYQNPYRAYRKDDFQAIGSMDMDLAEDVKQIANSTGGDPEKFFAIFFQSSGYALPKDNPLIYNQTYLGSSSMFLRDPNGLPVGIYSKPGALAIYKALN